MWTVYEFRYRNVNYYPHFSYFYNYESELDDLLCLPNVKIFYSTKFLSSTFLTWKYRGYIPFLRKCCFKKTVICKIPRFNR